MHSPKFSLIMATLGRDKEIISFLEVLLKQTYKYFELLIIDQNEDNRVLNIYNNYKEKLDIKYFHNDVKGLSVNRNIGLKNTSGEIIAFPDDDCIYESDTLEKAAAFFNENQNYSFYICNTRDIRGEGSVLKTKKNNEDISIFNFTNSGISFTIFVRNSAFKTFNFDENLGLGTLFGSGEESDLILFLLKNNNKGRYIAGNYIYHPVKSETAEKAFEYGKGFGAIYKKAVFYYNFIILLPIYFLRILKCFINIILYNNKKVRYASFNGRLQGFFYYKKQK